MEKYVALTALLACLSCTGEHTSPSGPPVEIAVPAPAENPEFPGRGPAAPEGGFSIWSGKTLEELTEMERSGAYARGMGMVESVIREDAGDYAGAVLAAYKELAWMYSYGLITKEAMETGLKNVTASTSDEGEGPDRPGASGLY